MISMVADWRRKSYIPWSSFAKKGNLRIWDLREKQYHFKFSDLTKFGRKKPLSELINHLRELFPTQQIRRILVVLKRNKYELKYFWEGLIFFEQRTKMDYLKLPDEWTNGNKNYFAPVYEQNQDIRQILSQGNIKDAKEFIFPGPPKDARRLFKKGSLQ